MNTTDTRIDKRTDPMDPARANALLAALGRELRLAPGEDKRAFLERARAAVLALRSPGQGAPA